MIWNVVLHLRSKHQNIIIFYKAAAPKGQKTFTPNLDFNLLK